MFAPGGFFGRQHQLMARDTADGLSDDGFGAVSFCGVDEIDALNPAPGGRWLSSHLPDTPVLCPNWLGPPPPRPRRLTLNPVLPRMSVCIFTLLHDNYHLLISSGRYIRPIFCPFEIQPERFHGMSLLDGVIGQAFQPVHARRGHKRLIDHAAGEEHKPAALPAQRPR